MSPLWQIAASALSALAGAWIGSALTLRHARHQRGSELRTAALGRLLAAAHSIAHAARYMAEEATTEGRETFGKAAEELEVAIADWATYSRDAEIDALTVAARDLATAGDDWDAVSHAYFDYFARLSYWYRRELGLGSLGRPGLRLRIKSWFGR